MKKNWILSHFGIPVTDLDITFENYRRLGFLPVKDEFIIDSSNYEEYLIYGKKPESIIKTRGILLELDQIRIELLQPLQGISIHSEFLDSGKNGIAHVAYIVEDIEPEITELQNQGYPVILSFTHKNAKKRSGVYIDTRKKNGFITELCLK